jgi:glyoxylase-like metal-dependent hydrolase (beta-lactamase superfamily II)
VCYARDHLIPLVDEGLGNSAYLADLGGGRALAVDASRDLRALREATAKRGLRVAFAADTHLHADFLSGAVQLATEDGATVLAAADGHREFPHSALAASAPARCWTSGRPQSTSPGTFPARSTSSSATCPPGSRTHLPGRW